MFVASYSRTMANANTRLRAQLAVESKRRAEAEAKLREERLAAAVAKAERQKEALERAAAFLAELNERPRRRITYAQIEAKAMQVFKVTRNEIRGPRRDQRFVLPRQFIAYWCSRLTSLSLPQIGKLMGGRDHTTIIHGRRAYPAKRKAMGRTLREAR